MLDGTRKAALAKFLTRPQAGLALGKGLALSRDQPRFLPASIGTELPDQGLHHSRDGQRGGRGGDVAGGAEHDAAGQAFRGDGHGAQFAAFQFALQRHRR